MENWETREALMAILTDRRGSMNGLELSGEMLRTHNIHIQTMDVNRQMGVAKRKGWVRGDRIGYGLVQYTPTGEWHPGLDAPKPHIRIEHVKRTSFTEASNDMLAILLRTTGGDALRQAKAEAERRGLQV